MQIEKLCSMTITISTMMLFSIINKGNSIKGIVSLSPSGNIIIYENRSITYTCFHPHDADLVQQFMWVVNGACISSTNNYLIVNEVEKQYTQLYIHQVTKDLNNTDVQCHAQFTTGDILRSQNSTVILQGLPLPVDKLELFVTDDYISVTWNEPYTIPVQGRVAITYRVTIESTTISFLPKTTSDTFYTYTAMSQPIGCDTYTFFVRAENPVGIGEVRSVSYVGLEPDHSSVELSSEGKEFNVILLIRSALLCRVSNLFVRNKNLDQVLVNDNFHTFTSLQAIGDTYRYLFNLSLPQRFEYELNMIIISSHFHRKLNFSISTHAVRSVYVKEVPESQLHIQIQYLADVFMGAFVSLLKCTIPSCDTINYNQSIFLTVYGTDVQTFNFPYERGDYLLYVYDVEEDGSIIPSVNTTSYPIRGNRLYLTYGNQLLNNKFNPDCMVIYEHKMVGLRCTHQELSGMQQLLLLPINNNFEKRIILSDPGPLNQIVCIFADNEDYYALSILLNNSSKKSSSVPIIKMAISPAKGNQFPVDICKHVAYPTTSLNSTTMASRTLKTVSFLVCALIILGILTLMIIAIGFKFKKSKTQV